MRNMLRLIFYFILLFGIALITVKKQTNLNVNDSVPAKASVLENVIKLSVGPTHNCVITNEGSAKCWGLSRYGEVGDGITGDGRKNEVHSPTDVKGLNQPVIDISAGFAHTCAVTSDGGVKCWGENFHGQLGNGTNDHQKLPVDVMGLGKGAVAITTGMNHSCVLLDTGNVKCWGRNTKGGLGDGSTEKRLKPVDVIGLGSNIKAISAGEEHTCALTQNGEVKCWGWNEVGTLGDGTMKDRLTPVAVVGLEESVVSIATKSYHTCALLVTHKVKCWGFNGYGQLGDGTTQNRSIPVAVKDLNDDIVFIAVGGVGGLEIGMAHTCVLKVNGIGKCWGTNTHGELGDGTNTFRITPVDIVGLTEGMMIGGGEGHTCTLIKSGAVKCWGKNVDGRLGDGTVTSNTKPVYSIGTGKSIFLPLISLYAEPDLEPNNDFASASHISSNIPITGQTSVPQDPRDYYAFSLRAGQKYMVVLDYIGDADLDLYIYDTEKNQIAKSQTNGNQQEKTSFLATSNNTYYVAVIHYSTTNSRQSYELIVEAQ